MKQKNTATTQEKNNTQDRLNRLRQSARTLQNEINNITKEIQELEIKLNRENTEVEREQPRRNKKRTENKNTESTVINRENVPLEAGIRIQYNRKGGKRLNKSNVNNGHGTITKITAQWIYFDTDDGRTLYRAPHNVSRI